MVSSRQLLMVDPDPAIHELLGGLLKREDRNIQDVYDLPKALDHLRHQPYDLVVAGQNGSDPIKFLRNMRAIRKDAKVILTGDCNPAQAIAAIRARAFGYCHKPLPGGHLVEMVQQALDSSAWDDDIRVLSARPEWTTLEVRSKLTAAERTTHLVRELMADVQPSVSEDLIAAFRELLMNGIEHGAKSDARKRVRVAILRTSNSVIVHMRDPGPGFSMDRIAHAAVCNPEDAPTRHVEIRAEQGQRPGGFGILMASNLVDDLLYNERGNEVVFVKNL
jgi:DNA-binding NarL/FixJ family response regulator